MVSHFQTQKVRDRFKLLQKAAGPLCSTSEGASIDTSNSKYSSAPIPNTPRYVPNIRI